jgi:homocysteine S-methyltransferase
MHTSSNLVSAALSIIGDHFDGPTYAYPESGIFEMPNLKFEDVISPADLAGYARHWKADGARALGGCCGLTPDHIRAISNLSAEK